MNNGKKADTDSQLPPFDLNSFTSYRVALAAQLLSEQLARHYRRQFGITIPEWRVLVHLVQAGCASVRDIENAVAMEKSKVSRTVARLERRGLIAKNVHSGDKRLVDLTLTSEGRSLMVRLLPVASEFQRGVEAAMGEDFPALAQTIEKIIRAFSGRPDQSEED